jgi:uncharacterized membrane protein
VILGQFLVLNVLLLSSLSLAFILGYDIKKIKCEGSIIIKISYILMRYYSKKNRRIQKERWCQREINKEIKFSKKKPIVYHVF